MKNHDIDFEKLAADIKDLLYKYVSVKSYTGTNKEALVDKFFLSQFSDIEYFIKHPDHYGLYGVDETANRGSVCWAMVRGGDANQDENSDTIVMIHHYDVVGIEDFGDLKEFAFSPDKLEKKLSEVLDMLTEDARSDLSSGDFIFGRGCADMKGGGAIQYALLKEYSRLDDFKGTVIVIGVPDEENLSAGMRAATVLLVELKKKYALNYKLMINSEPHQRRDPKIGIFSEGSIGKMMPFIYVRGFLAHAGKVFEGINPAGIMAAIVERIELNMDFADSAAGECAPPPTWLYLHDSKTAYDVSMPLSMYGYFSVLTLSQTPEQLMKRTEEVCREAFDEMIDKAKAAQLEFSQRTGRQAEKLPWETNVMSFEELCEMAPKNPSGFFGQRFNTLMNDLKKRISKGEMTSVDATFELVELALDCSGDINPKVIYGLIPPYYPAVSSLDFEEVNGNYLSKNNLLYGKKLYEALSEYAKENYGQTYEREYYYTGISDLSYSSIREAKRIRESLDKNMPLFGKLYDIPFDAIEAISMPCINIGPWGKAFHKLTERVNRTDLYERTPKILDHAVMLVLGEDEQNITKEDSH